MSTHGIKAPLPNRYASLVIPGYTVLAIPGAYQTFLSIFHNKSQSWRFGGGKMEEGELPLACAVREAYEEFGIEVTAARFLERVTHPADGAIWTGDWFLVQKFNGVLKLNEPHKHSMLDWLTLEDLRTENSMPEYEVALNYHEGRT